MTVKNCSIGWQTRLSPRGLGYATLSHCVSLQRGKSCLGSILPPIPSFSTLRSFCSYLYMGVLFHLYGLSWSSPQPQAAGVLPKKFFKNWENDTNYIIWAIVKMNATVINPMFGKGVKWEQWKKGGENWWKVEMRAVWKGGRENGGEELGVKILKILSPNFSFKIGGKEWGKEEISLPSPTFQTKIDKISQ